MALQITIGGQDRTTAIDLPSVRVTNALGVKSDTMDFDLTMTPGEFTRPSAGSEIIVTNGSTKEFAGVIARVDEEIYSPDSLVYRNQCQDYTRYMDKKMVVEKYPSQYADLIVRDVIAKYCPGFTTTNIKNAFGVVEQIFDYAYPSDVIRQLADSIEWSWYVDYDKDIHFFALEDFPAPIAELDLDNSTQYSDCIISEDVSQLKNRIYLKGFKSKSQNRHNVTHKGDGTTKWFPLGYEPSDLADITITKNGSPITPKAEMTAGQPGDGQTDPNVAYVCFDNMGIRFNNAPPLNDAINSDFNYAIEPVVMVEDSESQREMKARDNMDGVYEYMVNDPGLSGPSTKAARTKGKLLLYKYAYPKITGSFNTIAVQGWRAGQHFLLKSAKRMGGISERVYVTRVSKTIVSHPLNGSPTFQYKIEFADSPFAW